jgi:hypothetical protein
MKTTEIKTIKIEADEGKILTDGETYGSVIFLGANRNVDEFYEIPREEYDRIMEEQEKAAELAL